MSERPSALDRIASGFEPSSERAPTRSVELVVMAASAGGIEALGKVLSALPADFPVPIAIVQHRQTRIPELLPRVLARHSSLPVKLAEEGESLRPGVAFIAPSDRHLVVASDRTLHLQDGRRIKFVRSSANPLMDSAATALEGHVIAVVLSGTGTNSTDGVQAVKATGGHVIAQDPATALHAGMPSAAIASGAVDSVLPLDQIAPTLIQLTASLSGPQATQ